MDQDRWQFLQSALSAAVECSPEDRPALIERICKGDAELRAELESLLRQFDSDPEFLEQSFSGLTEEHLDGAMDDDPIIGETVGAWTIRSRIDRGGMGAVYLGERTDDGFEQFAAIKVIARGMDSETIIARFHTERRILAALEHPNIASILDGGVTADSRPWFAMRYLEAASPLDEYCDAHKLSINERLSLMLPICAAVQFAHQNLIIHRDIKPANLLVTSQGVPVLLDFGIAKLLVGNDDLTGTAQPSTPVCASPEQRAGGAVTTASDVYQLGALLYQLLCGQRPANDPVGEASSGTVRRPSDRINANHARLSGESTDGLRRKLRGDLDTICLQALHPEPQRRYRSADALADDLKRVLQQLPVQARPDTLAYRTGKFLLRNRWSASFAAALFVVAIGFGAFASLTAARMAEQSRIVGLERDRAQATADFLAELFSMADPTRVERDYSATEMLDRGLERVRGNDSLNDSERNAVLTAIGGVLQVRGDHERARDTLVEAVEIARHRGLDRETHARSLLELAKAEYRLDNYAMSERFAREALDLMDELAGITPDLRAGALNQIAVALSDQNQLDKAAEMLEQVVRTRRSLPDAETNQDLAANLNNLGLIYAELGRFEQARDAYDASLKIIEQRYGSHHPYGAFLRHARAELHELSGEIELARIDLKDALRIATSTLGEEHPFVHQAREDLETIDSGIEP